MEPRSEAMILEARGAEPINFISFRCSLLFVKRAPSRQFHNFIC